MSKIYIRYQCIQCMYDDNKTWKQHFDDWVKIVESSGLNKDVTPAQHEYRIKTIKDLIKAYKANL